MSEKDIIVRFAPSPTGHLHVGGARTALFNYLFAKKEGGKFLLRIEDTDKKRSTSEMSMEIIEGLEWLGLIPDSTPLYQSDNVENHTEIAKRLLAENRAYRCFCSKEEEDLRRSEGGKVVSFMYDRTCLNLSSDEIKDNLKNKIPYVIRFKVPQGETRFKDRIHKEVKINNSEIEDFILLRSDGSPTYQLSVVSDDISMKISDVIRGDDHLSNTFKQILLFLAIGKKPPRYSHLPLIMGPDRKKLSKRHGETSILEFRKKGYLPEALVTYFSHLSWSPPDHKKIYDLKTLTDDFKLTSISKNSPIFDHDKLNFINSKAIKGKDPIKILEILFKNNEFEKKYKKYEVSKLKDLIEMVKPRMKKIHDFIPQFDIFLSNFIDYDKTEFNKLKIERKSTVSYLEELENSLNLITDFNKTNVEIILRKIVEKRKVKSGDIIHPLRFALTNTTVSPSIFEIIDFLGKDNVSKRIKGFIEFLNTNVLSD